MTYRYLPTFLKLLSKLSAAEKIGAQKAIEDLMGFFESGLRSHGLGLKKLRRNYWEVRVNLSLRILFQCENSEVIFLVIGNHGDIQRALKNK